MSLINDALKQARKAAPASSAIPAAPAYLAPGLPAARKNHLPLVLSLGLVIPTVLFFVLRPILRPPAVPSSHAPLLSTPSAPPVPAVAAPPVPAQIPTPPAPPPEELPVAPVPPPVLQGIFYSPSDPSAIVDGKSVRPGDAFKSYRVQEISQSTVTLLDAAGRCLKISLGR